ncbi:MAG: DUF3383 family protein [Bacteroidales bacterium]
MSLPITGVVDVSLSLSPVAKALASFGKLAFVTKEVPQVQDQRVYAYGDAPAVAADWGAESEVAKAANAFYGNGGKDFMVIKAQAVSSAAKLRGVLASSVSLIAAVDAGGMTISVNGNVQFLTDLDFTLVQDHADVAEIINEALQGATVTVQGDSYIITSDLEGQGSEVGFAIDTAQELATLLGLTQLAGAQKEVALVPETPVMALVDAEDIDASFYGVVIHKDWRDSQDAEAVADYAQARRKIFFNTSNNPQVLVAGATEHILAKLKAKSMGRTLSHYSSKPEEYPSAAVAGRAFQVNFEGTNTTITLNLKVMAGVTVENLKTSQHNALVACNGNAVVDIAGMYVYSDSRMGDAQWFDAVHGTDWLQNRIETGVFNRLYATTTKVPYTDTGVSLILAEVEQALRQGVTNGLLAAGNNTAGEFLPLGYKITYIPTSQVAAADKSNRIYRGISFEAVGAGAMHKVVISGSFNE